MPTADLRRRLAELEDKSSNKNSFWTLSSRRGLPCRATYALLRHPILTLPVEITAEIFVRCLFSLEDLRSQTWEMDRAEQTERREELKTRAPIIFLGVCRAWRDIALTTPRLWTTLCFQYSFYETPDEIPWGPSEIEAFIDRWLSRAGHSAAREWSLASRRRPIQGMDIWDGGNTLVRDAWFWENGPCLNSRRCTPNRFGARGYWRCGDLLELQGGPLSLDTPGEPLATTSPGQDYFPGYRSNTTSTASHAPDHPRRTIAPYYAP
ncbi:hypothetical protein FB451DRAFT_1267815 [Mycena latifolia]|nr:hypothetical protein FB451DRAFT_1267815 [Mycena latifolia]